MIAYIYIKRVLDVVFSVIGILVLSPVFLLIVVLIKFETKGSIIFKQNRIGKDKKAFRILKFRTMREDTPANVPTHLLDNPELYITKIGKLLRNTSLDELPQLINILKGEMSIIGPRPALWNQYDLIEYRDKYNANSVKPGLTGWAQINGRDELPVDIKAAIDGEYVKNISLYLDMKIFFLTIWKVICGEGIIEGKANKKENNKRGALS